MTDDNIPLPGETRHLHEAAVELEEVVRDANRLPEKFEQEAVQDLCIAARRTATSPPEDRPILLRSLQETLAALHPTIPRNRDPETGDFDYAALRNAFNALQSEAAHLAGKISAAPDPVAPEDPRNDPDSDTAIELEKGGEETAQAARDARQHQQNANSGIVVNGDVRNAIIINIDTTEAAALIAKAASRLDDIAAKRFNDLGQLLFNWPANMRNTLTATSFVFELGADVAEVFNLKTLENKTRALGIVARKHAARLERHLQTGEPIVGAAIEAKNHTPVIELYDSIRDQLKEGHTVEAQALADLLGGREQNAGLPNGYDMDLRFSFVSDLSPLSGLTALQSLDVRNTTVSDVSPLSHTKALQALHLWDTLVSDVSPLSGLAALQTLDLALTSVSDLSPLSGLTALRSLNLNSADVSVVSALSGLTALQTLALNGTKVSDLSPLAGLTALQTLYLRGTGLSDVSPLAGLRALQYLDLSDTGVSDVSPLAGLTALQSLDLRGSSVSDMSPLSALTALETVVLPDGEQVDWQEYRKRF